MKRPALLLLSLFALSVVLAQEQAKTAHKLPSVDVRTLDGKAFNTRDIAVDGKPVLVSFWALWCKPCIKELTTIAEVYPEWQKETGVTLYAVSIDDSRSSSRVQPFVDSKDWDYKILLDANGDFKRAMNVNMIPHTFLLNGKGEIVWQHTSFAEGAELELIDLVRKVARGESIQE